MPLTWSATCAARQARISAILADAPWASFLGGTETAPAHNGPQAPGSCKGQSRSRYVLPAEPGGAFHVLARHIISTRHSSHDQASQRRSAPRTIYENVLPVGDPWKERLVFIVVYPSFIREQSNDRAPRAGSQLPTTLFSVAVVERVPIPRWLGRLFSILAQGRRRRRISRNGRHRPKYRTSSVLLNNETSHCTHCIHHGATHYSLPLYDIIIIIILHSWSPPQSFPPASCDDFVLVDCVRSTRVAAGLAPIFSRCARCGPDTA